MQLQQIESFIAVAEAANFTHAAQTTHVSQPTLTRQVKLLEKELGCSLIERDKRPLRLTAAGEVFLEGMRKVLSQMDYVCDMTRAAAHGKSGKLSIGFTIGLYTEYMYLDVINDLRESCPQLDVHCVKKRIADLPKAVRDGSVDIAFSLDYSQFAADGLRVTELAKLPTVIVMSARHQLASKITLDRGDLDGQTLFLNAPVQSYRLETWMDNVFNLDCIEVVEVSSTEEAYMNVLAERGLTVSNVYDPIIHNGDLYQSILLPKEAAYPAVCAIDDPANRNPAKELMLDLVRHADV